MGRQEVFLILHGTGGNAPGHWQHFLARELRAAGKDVRYPRLPRASVPLLKNWMPSLARELAGIDPDSRLTVVAHSRSCILWMHHAAQHAQGPPSVVAERVLLVAPPFHAQEPEGPRLFFPAPLSPEGTANVARRTSIVASDDDEFASFEEAERYAGGLAIPIFKLPSSGHISPAYGYGDWPWVLSWCLSNADLPPEPRYVS